MEYEELKEHSISFRYGSPLVHNVIVISVYHSTTKFHPEPQWLVQAYDIDRKEFRTFTLSMMNLPSSTFLNDVFIPRNPEVHAYIMGLTKARAANAPFSDTLEAKNLMAKVMAERNYPSSPLACARAGWEALHRLINEEGK